MDPRAAELVRGTLLLEEVMDISDLRAKPMCMICGKNRAVVEDEECVECQNVMTVMKAQPRVVLANTFRLLRAAETDAKVLSGLFFVLGCFVGSFLMFLGMR